MASLPVLASLTEMLTGAVTEEFKKLLQPASLVAAAVFMALNLVLIYPVLIDKRVGPAVAIEALPSAWQVVLGTLTLFALGYVINSLGGFFLGVLNGNAFRNSPLVYDWLRYRQRQAFKSLHKQTDDKARAEYRLAFEFPQQEAELAPTRLGNILLSAASYTWHQYRAHLDTLWPIMDLTLQENDEKLRNRLRESRDALTFLASLTVLLAVVALELVIVGSVLQRPLRAILGGLATLVVAYIVYRAALHKAQAWGRDVRTAFDLHLDSVAKKLGLRDLPRQKFKDRRTRWEAVSKWLAYGATFQRQTSSQDEDWYVAAPRPPQVLHPPTISVEGRCQVRSGTTPNEDKTQMSRWVEAGYLFYITNAERGKSAHAAGGTFLLVTDSRMSVAHKVKGKLSVPDPSKPKSVDVDAEWHLDEPPTLFWTLGKVPAVSSRVLKYTAFHDEVIVKVSTNFEVGSLRPAGREVIEVKVRNKAETSYKVTVTVQLPNDKYLPDLTPNLMMKGQEIEIESEKKDPKERKVCWTPKSEVPPETSFVLRFTRKRV